MAFNPSIILGVRSAKFDQSDPVEQFGIGLKLKGLLQQQQIQDQAMADDQATRSAFAQSGGDSAKYLQALAAGGNYKAYRDVQKAALEAEKERATIGHLGAQTSNQNATAAKNLTERDAKAISMHRDMLAGVNDPQAAAQWLVAGYQDPITGPIMQRLSPLEEALKRIPSDPAQFEQWKQQSALGATKFIEMNKPTIHMQNLGGTSQVIATPGLGGPVSVLSNTPITQSADNAATQATARRGQNMTDARARELNALTKEGQQTQVVNDPNQGILLVNKSTKTVVPAKFADGRPVPSENAVAADKLQRQLQEGIAMARDLIPKATNSGAGAMVDKVANFAGASTAGADAASQLETLAGWMTANVPRMQGPQSDKDVLLYRQMAAQVGDPTVPAARRLAALNTLEQLQMKYSAINKGGASGEWVNSPAKTKAGASVSNW